MDQRIGIPHKLNDHYNHHSIRILVGSLDLDHMDSLRNLANSNMHRLHFVRDIPHSNRMAMDCKVLLPVLVVLLFNLHH